MLDNNVIEELPEHIFNLPLVRLSVNDNRLVTLNHTVAKLVVLEELLLCGNCLCVCVCVCACVAVCVCFARHLLYKSSCTHTSCTHTCCSHII